MQWHLLSIEQALQEAGSRQAGLDPEEVAELVYALVEDDLFLCAEVLSLNSGTVI